LGQGIEHITEEHSFRVYAEVRRVLKPDGQFCLDTPNRLLTLLHTGGPLIHPEHRIEYTPQHLQKNLMSAGFKIERALGVCEMLLSTESGVFDYRDFVIGNNISRDVDGSYVQYYACRPQL
jgi:predicted SAM-dependent methyltransferase